MRTLLLVFTDLDGSLLDHYSYDYRDALPQLRRLVRSGVPVIPASSKTRAEIERLRAQIDLHGPFIAENGAAAFIPVGFFRQRPPAVEERDGFWVKAWSAPRQRWLEIIASLRGEFADEFDCFSSAGATGVMAMTGLSAAAAADANTREYSEPVKWLGSERRKQLFLERLRGRGASVLEGGRFLSVSGDCDKGRALEWLREAFQREYPDRTIHDLAVGDGDNDTAMLEAAGTALLVRSPVHDFPRLARDQGVMCSTDYGPAGWSEGVARWLQGAATTSRT